MKNTDGVGRRLALKLVREELFDLTLYKIIQKRAPSEEALLLSRLIPVEAGHLKFWKEFFDVPESEVRLSIIQKIKLWQLALLCRIFGKPGIHLILQALEVYGIRKYLDIWNKYKDGGLGAAVRGILDDEFKHEDELIAISEKKRIHPERIRDIFFGFNDGLTEILGAVSGFFAAFQYSSSVIIAGITVAVAGSISMAAGAYAATSSANEVEILDHEKKVYLGEKGDELKTAKPLSSALVTGIFYFFGAIIPLLPVLFGANNILASVAVAVLIVALVSYAVAFITGMQPARRIKLNLVIIAIAVVSAYTIGIMAKNFFGISI